MSGDIAISWLADILPHLVFCSWSNSSYNVLLPVWFHHSANLFCSYSHAHDFAESDERVELSAALLFYFAVGAIASPIVAALLIQEFGTGSFFVFIAGAHFLLAIIGGLRMLLGDIALSKTPYIYSPRTSF